MTDFSLLAGLVGLAPGAVGGICNVCVGHPLDLMKVRQQTAPRVSQAVGKQGSMALGSMATASAGESTLGMLRGVLMKEGVTGLYRGVSAPLVAVIPAFAINFWSYDRAACNLRRLSNQAPGSELSISQVSIAGGCSGVALAFIIGPTERIKCLLQTNKNQYSGFLDCARQVYQEGGMRSIFRGTGSAILRDVPGNAIYFGSYEYLKRFFMRVEGAEKASTSSVLMAGGFAGIANWLFAIPLDTIKTRWQTAPIGTYRNLLDVFQTLVRNEGVPALYRGLSASLMRAFPANAACLCGVETVKGMLEERR